MTSSSTRIFPECPSRQSVQDWEWTCSLRRQDRNQACQKQADWSPSPGALHQHWWNETVFTCATVPSRNYTARDHPSPLQLEKKSWHSQELNHLLGLLRPWKRDTRDSGSLLIFGLETQRTNGLALHVMNRGVKSLNCLHLLCLKFDESDLERIFSTGKFWILKRDFLYVHLHTEKGENPLKNYQYQRNSNRAKELSLFQHKTSFPNTEMWRSFPNRVPNYPVWQLLFPDETKLQTRFSKFC